MKKILIHLFPYKFISHDYKIREFAELEKKFKRKVIVHDLSKIFYPKLNYIKAKNFRKSIKFKSINQWVKTLSRLKKHDVVILNELVLDSFKSLIIHYYLKKSNFPIFLNSNPGVVDESSLFSADLNFEKIKIKFMRIFKNPNLFIFYLKKKILMFLFSLIKFSKITIFLVGNKNKSLPLFHSSYRAHNKKIVKVHFRDYSNFLNYKKNNIVKKNKPIVFLDSTFPYFMDDETLLFKQKRELDVVKWYKEHNEFFDKLENFFSTKVIVVSHPKTKGVKNPFLKKRFIDHRIDATLKLTSSSLFFLCGMYVSTAISFPISAYKPIFFLYSDQMKLHYERQVIVEKEAAKLIGSGLLDINNFTKNDILKNMKVNKKLYDNYKYRFLTSKRLSKKPNHIILGELI